MFPMLSTAKGYDFQIFPMGLLLLACAKLGASCQGDGLRTSTDTLHLLAWSPLAADLAMALAMKKVVKQPTQDYAHR